MFQHMPTWTTCPVPTSSHIICCARCKRKASEAGSLELYGVTGEGAWSICMDCLRSFTDFIFMVQGGATMDDVVITYGVNDDVDVSEHHLKCQCIECRIDAGQYDMGWDADDVVKFWKENRDDDYRSERLTA